MGTATRAGQAGLQGWRGPVANRIAKPVADHSKFDEDRVRAVIGAAFLALSVIYVVKSALALTRSVRDS
jgi:hypothetical protein